jgi:hypothetical protein
MQIFKFVDIDQEPELRVELWFAVEDGKVARIDKDRDSTTVRELLVPSTEDFTPQQIEAISRAMQTGRIGWEHRFNSNGSEVVT